MTNDDIIKLETPSASSTAIVPIEPTSETKVNMHPGNPMLRPFNMKKRKWKEQNPTRVLTREIEDEIMKSVRAEWDPGSIEGSAWQSLNKTRKFEKVAAASKSSSGTTTASKPFRGLWGNTDPKTALSKDQLQRSRVGFKKPVAMQSNKDPSSRVSVSMLTVLPLQQNRLAQRSIF